MAKLQNGAQHRDLKVSLQLANHLSARLANANAYSFGGSIKPKSWPSPIGGDCLSSGAASAGEGLCKLLIGLLPDWLDSDRIDCPRFAAVLAWHLIVCARRLEAEWDEQLKIWVLRLKLLDLLAFEVFDCSFRAWPEADLDARRDRERAKRTQPQRQKCISKCLQSICN